MTKLEASERLHDRARAFVTAFEGGEPSPEPFDALACELARFQAAHVPGYQRLVRSRGVDVSRLVRAGDAPAVPTDAFKISRVSAFDEADTPNAFRTSGTTLGARGTHFFRHTETYDRGAIASAKATLFRDLPANTRALVVGPPPVALPDSSLTHMLALFVAAFHGTRDIDVGASFVLDGDVFDVAALDERVAEAQVEEVPVVLMGTSFGFVHFLDALGDDTFQLPPGSRVMTTGGFKGKSREVSEGELRAAIARVFAVNPGDVVSEYGMTELSSQFYEGTSMGGPAGVFVEPPWARITPVDPDTLEPVKDGEVGIARITDLLNVDSAAFVLAADRVRRVAASALPNGSGFELLGRSPGAPPRGCSIAIDEILGR